MSMESEKHYLTVRRMRGALNQRRSAVGRKRGASVGDASTASPQHFELALAVPTYRVRK
jgi:hypothetical protein